MTAKRPTATSDVYPPAADAIPILQREDESEARAAARALLRPTVNSARTLRRVLQQEAPTLVLMDLADELTEQCLKVCGGDMKRPEALLLTQAETLNALFNDLARRAYDHLGEYGDAADRLFRLAFRAQGQSRATLETLGALKNPPMVFAKQANVTTGPQQVNNGVARARRKKSKLGEANYWRKPMANHGWTPERRAAQSLAIRSWRPWTHSTGPRTKAGKRRASRNACQGDKRGELRTLLAKLREILREQRRTLPRDRF